MEEAKYKIRVVRGAFVDPGVLNTLDVETIEKLEEDDWISIDKITATLNEIRGLQKEMVKHFDNPNVPWYMDGYGVNDKNELIVAFGADDGEGGRIFQFARDDEKGIEEVIRYGTSKGIPKEQMDFHEIDF